MAIHPDLPKSPYEILAPKVRWFPADESLRDATMDKLMPPLVVNLRKAVKSFRDSNYDGSTETSKNLLNWWFLEKHLNYSSEEFRYFFAQREALETVIYLYDVIQARSKFDLMRFDSSALVTEKMFDESWLRMVIKMATGTGKTKVMSLALAWSFFHKTYEPRSALARNFLVIAPNIIVLDRIYKDFEGLKIFWEDPIVPDNGYAGRNWKDDFQLVLHKQDEVHTSQAVGNVFLTNIQRVYTGKELPARADAEDSRDYFLGKNPSGTTTASKVDLGVIVREVDELTIINDEAHHVHDSKLAWFQSIEDIRNHMLQKGSSLSLQLDVTATPRHTNGAIFVQTISDYPLVEAIHQNVVKHPVLPDKPSREKLHERQSALYVEKYADFLNLGVIEWRKTYEEHIKLGKKAILFVMTDDTRNCDEVAEYLEKIPDLEGTVLTIHTKNNGEINEASYGKGKDELELLRKESNRIDSEESKYKAIVSVLMLKEGWDVRNVTTIVGLRAYSSKSTILPEQSLGRGLRKMYQGLTEEYVSVIGTEAFMDFIESIQAEGVELERKAMGADTEPKTPLVVEVDKKKDLSQLDIEIPILSPSVYRDYKNLSELGIASFDHDRIECKKYTEEELKEIFFKKLNTDEIEHITRLDVVGIADYRSVIGWFARTIMKDLRLFSGYDILYPKVELFIQDQLFTERVNLEDQNTIRNLSEKNVTETIINTFKKAINELTIKPQGETEIRDYIKLRNTRPFIVNAQDFTIPKKSIFNRIVGDSQFELDFAAFLDTCPDVVSHAKNYLSINYKLDYVNNAGNISNYHPDFFVKLTDNTIIIVETKGLSDLDVPLKMARLKTWCDDLNARDKKQKYDFLFVDQDTFEKYQNSEHGKINKFVDLFKIFTKYK
jgi:type III restriction enzyme